jgi:hypothetical protein
MLKRFSDGRSFNFRSTIRIIQNEYRMSATHDSKSQHLILLRTCQFVENVKWMGEALAAPGVVGLQALNYHSCFVRHVVQPISIFDLSTISIAGVANRKQTMNCGLAIP